MAEVSKPCILSCVELNSGQLSLLQQHFTVYRLEDIKSDEDREKIVAITMFPNFKVTEEFISSFPNLSIISAFSVGYEHIDVKAAKKRGIRVGNTPDVLNNATAEVAMSLILACARRVVEGDALCRDPDVTSFAPYTPTFLGTDVTGSTLGIIGMGRIGSIVARMACFGFAMNIIYHNRSRAETEVEEDLKATYYSSLHEMLSECDFVVLTAPSTPDTYRMMGKKEFSVMKDSATFVNVSRGLLVDHDALAEALSSGGIRYAGLDVSDPEPLPRDHALLSLKNIVFTPHVGSATVQTRLKMMDVVVKNILAVLNNTPMVSEV